MKRIKIWFKRVIFDIRLRLAKKLINADVVIIGACIDPPLIITDPTKSYVIADCTITNEKATNVKFRCLH